MGWGGAGYILYNGQGMSFLDVRISPLIALPEFEEVCGGFANSTMNGVRFECCTSASSELFDREPNDKPKLSFSREI